jgi:hypothetical protein
MKCIQKLLPLFFAACIFRGEAQELYRAPSKDMQTKWISPENPKGEKGGAAKTNKGAKGEAFVNLLAGEKLVMMDVNGAGIIHRMWISGTIPRSAEQRRMIKIEMYWDGESKPAVSAPIGDFFGIGLGLAVPFENALFSNPEGRSFNFTIPMPFRTSARIVLVNESSSHALVWFDINYTAMEKLPPDAMYFHSYWNRVLATNLGEDYVLLPRVKGRGRYLGTNVGVIGDSAYRGTWFGEGEVKIYLDGDERFPSLAGTGTEDYIGSGWGQGEFCNPYQGSLISDDKNDLYAFYRFHIPDPVYFHKDCKVTIQQIGNTSVERIKDMLAKNVKLIPTWYLKKGDSDDIFDLKGKAPEQVLLLDKQGGNGIYDKNLPPIMSASFYRSDDVSATVYFYLDKPSNNLNSSGDKELRIKDMNEKVWSKTKRK